jgi:tetratricopeptide (TPR) repeat protein
MIVRPTGPRRTLEVTALLALCALAPQGASSVTARPDGGPVDPAPEPAPYALALEHYRSQRFAEAADVIESAIRSGTADAGHLSLLGWCYVHLRSFHQAIPIFQAALRDHEDSLEARQGLAVALAEDGRGSEAIDLVMRLVDEHPGDEGTAAVLRRVLGAARMEEDRRLRPVDRESLPPEPRALARAGSRYLEVRPSSSRGSTWAWPFRAGSPRSFPRISRSIAGGWNRSPKVG